MTKQTENQILLEKLLAEHAKIENEKKAKIWETFFAECKISTISQKLIRDSYNVYKKMK